MGEDKGAGTGTGTGEDGGMPVGALAVTRPPPS
jgi:hypothetical protein